MVYSAETGSIPTAQTATIPTHSAGPWFCEYGTDGYYALYRGDEPIDDNVPANERLIAAAPDLLAALVRMVEVDDDAVVMDTASVVARLADARAAIAKATGQ